MKESDRIILELIRAGDKAGLKKLFDVFYRPLVMYAQQFILKKEEAEDLVQDVFIRFWETKSYLDVKTNIRSYIYQAVRNTCLNYIKQNTKYKFGTLNELPEIPEEEMLDESDWNDCIQEIYGKIDLLPTRTQEIFKSIVIEHMKYKEVAAKFNISVNTVKTSLSRALAILRTELSKGSYFVLLISIGRL
jgi:RNA polymerase sigma-70 factor (family 1)